MLRHNTLLRAGRLFQKCKKQKYYKNLCNSSSKNTSSSTTSSTLTENKSGSGRLLTLSLFLLGGFVGAAYTVEQSEDLEQTIQSYDIPFILDGMAPIREGVRSIGFGRPTQDVEKSQGSDDSAEEMQQTGVDEEELPKKDLHDDALEELAEDLIAEAEPHNEFVVIPEQVPKVIELLRKCRELVELEERRSAPSVLKVEKSVEVVQPKPKETASVQKEEPKVGTHEQVDESPPTPQKEVIAHIEAKEEAPSVPSSKSRLLEARQDALEEILKEMAKETTALRDETERNLAHNLEGMDEAALRYRIAQLTTEFFERIKWEGIRQQQALHLAEEALAKKYSDLLTQQENELKLAADKKQFELEKSLREEANDKVQNLQIAQETRVHEALSKQEQDLREQFKKDIEEEKAAMMQSVTDEHNLEVAMLKEHHVKQMLETQKDIKAANENISALFRVVNSEFGKTTVSTKAHALSAAIYLAEDALVKSSPVEKEIAALGKFSGEEPLIDAVVKSLPPSVSTNGAPVLDDIKLRFKVVRDEARKASLAPDVPFPLFSQSIGNLLSILPMPSGNVQGDNVDAALARIDYHLERNNLELALKETRNISGYPRTLMADWEQMAQDRLVVDQAIRTLKTISALRHLDLS